MAKKYAIKEIYYTLQGEGYHTGTPAIFCRFSGCNLWSGLEEDRHKAICQFCDTSFWGTDGINGGKYALQELINKIHSLFPAEEKQAQKFIVLTGGEPALQVDHELVSYLQKADFTVAIETNGTKELPTNLDWITVSPKANTDLVIKQGNELKLVFPQPGAMPEQYKDLNFDHFYLQPMDGKDWEVNSIKTINYCKEHPQWKMSVQTHKFLNIP